MAIALAGDLGIAVSLALTRAFIKWKLSSVFGDSESTLEVSLAVTCRSWGRAPDKGSGISSNAETVCASSSAKASIASTM
ncbi:MAG: hypothetical protein CL912_08565 [Deltaproteobacteria bacterium]|nr:hypothetical protein [Deltaproteobacteria bacterium]